jgi:hypothetical protein
VTGVPLPPAAFLARELLSLELAVARRDASAVPEGLASLIAPDFVEFGSSGRTWDAASIVASLARPNPDAITIDEFVAYPLSETVVLVTYRMTETPPGEEPRGRLRSSIWIRRGDRWVMRFHQGTPTT